MDLAPMDFIGLLSGDKSLDAQRRGDKTGISRLSSGDHYPLIIDRREAECRGVRSIIIHGIPHY